MPSVEGLGSGGRCLISAGGDDAHHPAVLVIEDMTVVYGAPREVIERDSDLDLSLRWDVHDILPNR